MNFSRMRVGQQLMPGFGFVLCLLVVVGEESAASAASAESMEDQARHLRDLISVFRLQ
jgi:hypothetical protein